MGFLMKLFGTCGKVRFEGFMTDGEKFTGKTEIECFNVSQSELEEKLKDMMHVETGKYVKEIYITGFVEC